MHPAPRWLLRTPEGRVFLAGLAVLFTGLTLTLALTLASARHAGILASQTVAHAALGREAAIPLAIALGHSPLAAAAFSIWLGAINLLVGLPLLVALEKPLRKRFPRLDRWLAAKEAEAREMPPAQKATGLAGLALASVIPLIPVGALGSAVLGIALGYPIVPLVLTLLAALVVVDLAWAFASGWLTDALARVHPAAQWALVLGVLAAVAWVTVRGKR